MKLAHYDATDYNVRIILRYCRRRFNFTVDERSIALIAHTTFIYFCFSQTFD